MDGFSAPVKKALTARQYWGGVPRGLFLINVVSNILILIVLKTWIIVIFGLLIHFICRFFADKDPDFFDIFLRYLIRKPYYYEE